MGTPGLILKTIVLVLMLGISISSQADLNQEMANMFSGMVNVTPADAYMTQRRGVISGGSIMMRNNVVNPSLISFVPPSFKGGCNGIDLFGGSFSFINSEQFMQLLRNVAQAAAGYAFQLAIEGMCPTCAQVMAKLQDKIQQLNGMMRNSCDLAKTAVDTTGLRAWHDKRMDDARGKLTGIGAVDDWLGADAYRSKSPTQVAIEKGKPDEVTGNVVKEALDQSAAETWFTSSLSSTASGTNIEMVLMSLTGTLITSTKAGAANDGGTDLQYVFKKPTLEVKDFLEGGSVQIYACDDEKCLNPIPATYNLVGMRDRVRTMLFGQGVCSACTGGIVREMANRGAGGFSVMEQQFLQAASPGPVGLLFKIAAEPGSMAIIAERMIDMLAVDMTNQLVDEIFDTVQSAVYATGRPLDSSMNKVLQDRRAQLNEQRRKSAESMASVNYTMDIYGKLRTAIKDDRSTSTD